MEKKSLEIAGAYLFTDTVFRDNRGAFEVFWEWPIMTSFNINFTPVNAHHSYNSKAHTLRGMHYQSDPFGQAKLVNCFSGKVYDVMLDLRRNSSSFGQWTAVTLEAGSGQSVYIPAGCAHGFVTLEDNSGVAYLIEGDYHPEAAAAVRWNDPKFNIYWPVTTGLIISARDENVPDFAS